MCGMVSKVLAGFYFLFILSASTLEWYFTCEKGVIEQRVGVEKQELQQHGITGHKTLITTE